MRRRALLSTGAVVAAALAGCSTRSEEPAAEAVDGAELTLRREHTGAFEPDASSVADAVVLRRAVDADPPRLTVRGRLLDGSRDCYRVVVTDAELTADALALRATTEDRPDWEGDVCDDVAEPHFYEVAVSFTEAPVPDRVVVRHGDETVLEEPV